MKNKKVVVISSRNCGKRHISEATLEAFENAFMSNGCPVINRSKYIWYMNRILNKLKLNVLFKDSKLINTIRHLNPSVVFVCCMNCNTLLNLKYDLKKLNIPIALYCVDTWEPSYSQWIEILNEIRPNYIFCAFLKTAVYFQSHFEHVFFLPYSMSNTVFNNYGEKKTLLFMQMGRRNQALHQMILSYIGNHNIDEQSQYCYERQPGQVIFPQPVELARNINKTKFFILAPQDRENYTKTGNISEVTARYYEGMACKSLLVGYKPVDTFNLLFPYPDAMVEINESGSDFEEKISWFLTHEKEYNKIIEKNYSFVMNNHTWNHRVTQVIYMLFTNKQYDYHKLKG